MELTLMELLVCLWCGAEEAIEALSVASLLPPLVRLIVAYGGFGETRQGL
jgi:hypothetical protein